MPFRRSEKIILGMAGVMVIGGFIAVAVIAVMRPMPTTNVEAQAMTPAPVVAAPKPPPEPKRTFLHSGDTGVVNGTCGVAINDEAWDAMNNALLAKDNVGMVQLFLSGQVFAVKKGDSVLVLDSAFTSYKVRAKSGEEVGHAGWVVRECVDPL